MKLHMVAVRDIKANVFGQPNFVLSLGGAIRGFGDECQREGKDNLMYNHPEDFELYHLGWYGDGDAHFEVLAKPEQIAIGGNYRR